VVDFVGGGGGGELGERDSRCASICAGMGGVRSLGRVGCGISTGMQDTAEAEDDSDGVGDSEGGWLEGGGVEDGADGADDGVVGVGVGSASGCV